MKLGSLFSGIGGLELGLELATGARVSWQVEQDPYCRSVLAKHWPSAERFDDVCSVGSRNLSAVDIVCGGFPCQDLSFAGKGAGLQGERSGLWFEYARIVRELRPRFVVVENVPALLSRGLDAVLGSLAESGYDAEWSVLRASDVGAPHRRERLFLIAWLADAGCIGEQPGRAAGDVPGSAGGDQGQGDQRQRVRHAAGDAGEALAHPDGIGHAFRARFGCDAGEEQPSAPGAGPAVANGNGGGLEGLGGGWLLDRVWPALRNDADGRDGAHGGRQAQPGLGRALDGVPPGLDGRWPARPGEAQHPWEAPRTVQGRIDRRRLKALGNAVVPACSYVVGQRVMEISRALSLATGK